MTRPAIPKEKPKRREEPLAPMPTIEPRKEPDPLPAPKEPEKVPVGGIESMIPLEFDIAGHYQTYHRQPYKTYYYR